MKRIENDNMSLLMKDIVKGIKKEHVDSPDFLDICSWNLCWFNSRDTERVKNISNVLSVINSDIFIFLEVEDGSLEEVEVNLKKNGAGFYKSVYGTTGGDQRVAIMYDTEWIKAKDELSELFGKGAVMTVENQDAFPRLPLHGYFEAKSPIASNPGFTFQLTGVHLKSQMNDGSIQRRLSAEKLAYWLKKDANELDSDVIIMGDFNKDPDSEDWEAIHQLEKTGDVKFSQINDSSEISHLYYKNKREIGSRLDLSIVSTKMSRQMANNRSKVVKWITVDEMQKNLNELSAKDIKGKISEVKKALSDHMILQSRFYLKRLK